MTEIPVEWCADVAWAARDAAVATLNAERAARFESVKALILERDLPPWHACQKEAASNISTMQPKRRATP